MTSAQCTVFHFRHSADGPEAITQADLTEWANAWFKYWVFQQEKGDSGYLHWQGTGSLLKKRRPHELKNVMRKDDGFLPMYLEPMVGAEAKAIRTMEDLLATYAAKADTRIAGPFTSTRHDEYIPPQYQNKELVPWQRKLVEIGQRECRELDGRTIHWVYDWTGNHGKSVLSALLELQGKGIDMPPCNDYEKLCASLCDVLMDTGNREPGIIMLDLPRAMSKNQMNGFTTACEQWKKGKVVDMRNHFRQWWFATPSVWIFSNTKPPMSHFSKGKWKVWAFDQEGLEASLVPYKPGMELTYGDATPLEDDA